MIDFTGKKLLVVAPHPDDEVIGCGGLISKIKNEGGEVYVLFLTVGSTINFASQGRSTQEERLQEIEKVAEALCFNGWHVGFPGNAYHLKLDQIPQKEIIDTIERGKDISLETIKPDIVIFPLLNDYNQDHRAAAMAAFTACRPVPRTHKFVPDAVMSYEAPMDWWSHDTAQGKPNVFVVLSEQQAKEKLEAMHLYRSQLREAGHPRNTRSLQALMEFRGACVGARYAEGYYGHKVCIGS